MKKIIAFFDTNTILHFQDLAEIDWRSVLTCDEVLLVLAPITISELDKKKYEANGRIRERARAAISRFERLWGEGPIEPVVRDGVKILFLEHTTVIYYAELGLDKDDQDDRLIGSIIHFREQHSGEPVTLVTADFGLKRKCVGSA
jgi:predicted ribonuclease YlaK